MARVVEKREEHFLSRFPWMSLALHFPRTQSTPNSLLWDSKPEPPVGGAWLLQRGWMTWHSSSVRSPLEWGRGLNSPPSSSLPRVGPSTEEGQYIFFFFHMFTEKFGKQIPGHHWTQQQQQSTFQSFERVQLHVALTEPECRFLVAEVTG